MQNKGFTLIEVTVVVAILSIVIGTLLTLGLGIGRATRTQGSKITAHDDVRMGLAFAASEIRQASRFSIAANNAFPTNSLNYTVAIDKDGNGTAVDDQGDLELSGLRTLGPDLGDANGDGLTATQLVYLDPTNPLDEFRVRVITNGLVPNEDTNGNGTLDAGEDQNNNGRLEQGVVFTRIGRGILITIDAQNTPGANEIPIVSTISELVAPRN